MKVGFPNVILKPRGRVTNGTRHSLQELASANQKSTQWSPFFFRFSRVAHEEFVPPGVTVNLKYYLEVLNRPRNRVMQVRTEIADDWILRASSRQRARTHSIVSS
jgi:hypothetical protein